MYMCVTKLAQGWCPDYEPLAHHNAMASWQRKDVRHVISRAVLLADERSESLDNI